MEINEAIGARPVWVEVDLDAIAHNIIRLREIIGRRTRLLAVVKANAYGHGAIPVAKTAIEAGAEYLGVISLDEGIELREANIKVPALIMGYTPAERAEEVVKYNLTSTVTTEEFGVALSRFAVERKLTARVHIKVNTGMNRFGLPPVEAIELAHFLRTLPKLKVEGLCTHLATADEVDKSFAKQQFQLFLQVAQSLPWIPLRHVANSAALLDMPEMALDLVRPGISLYGYRPSPFSHRAIQLKPALSLKSHVVHLHWLAPGDGVSYGRTWVAQRPTRVALAPCGYSHGLPRALSNRGLVLIRGRRTPILGRVCMDQCVVDVTSIPDVQIGDEVVIIGRQGEEEINADEVAQLSETITYEILCGISARVPRIYLKDGKIVSGSLR